MENVHRLYDLRMFKRPHHPKLSTDSMQELSESRWHFLQKQKHPSMVGWFQARKIWFHLLCGAIKDNKYPKLS